ncbi:MAG: acetyl-CoA synthase subunit gamma, partial [Oscillospiraceae bacterium]|nr:acetyl-CoA synthase subunit gamma [Oscillospiraceae bacterium]
MALKGLDIFKLTPKKNCKECGCPTCMAFSMKVAQGALTVDKCPHMSADSLAKLSAATEPPMKVITVGEHKLGGETVMLRHEKTLVNRNMYGLYICAHMPDEMIDANLAEAMKVDYERIGERMYVETIYVNAGTMPAARGAEVAAKANATGRPVIVYANDIEQATAALDACKENAAVLAGANADNWEAFNSLATERNLVLGVGGKDLSECHDTIEKLEAAGNKNLMIHVSTESIKDAFAWATQIRRAAIKGGDRTFGYPTIVNTAWLAERGDT